MEKFIYDCDARKPFDWLCYEPWNFISDANLHHADEYAYADDIYRLLSGDISMEYFLEMNPEAPTDLDELRKVYNKMMSVQIARTLRALADELDEGQTEIDFEF